MCPSPNSTSFLSPAMSSLSRTDLLQMPSNNSIRKQIETLQVSCLASVACAALPLPFPRPGWRLARYTLVRRGDWTVAASPRWRWGCTGVFDLQKRSWWCCHKISSRAFLACVPNCGSSQCNSHICECCLAVSKGLSLLMKRFCRLFIRLSIITIFILLPLIPYTGTTWETRAVFFFSRSF